MTEILKNAVNLNTEEKYVEYSDELVKDWLDNIIDTYDEIWGIIWGIPRNIGIGELVDGTYENELGSCRLMYCKDVHITSGIELLAEALGTDLKHRRITYDNGDMNDEYSFKYRGYNVFELQHVGE